MSRLRNRLLLTSDGRIRSMELIYSWSKGKVVPVHDMQAYGGVEVEADSFLT